MTAKTNRTGPSNIVLIGMPAAGKSTIGVLLAKALSLDFLDTDVYIQAHQNQTLQQIIDSQGLDAFRLLEQNYILQINCQKTVIATGGSVVYSPTAMAHLKKSAIAIHLDLPLAEIKSRITNLAARGVVIPPKQTLEDLYHQRRPLYQQYADITINTANRNHQQTLTDILHALNRS